MDGENYKPGLRELLMNLDKGGYSMGRLHEEGVVERISDLEPVCESNYYNHAISLTSALVIVITGRKQCFLKKSFNFKPRYTFLCRITIYNDFFSLSW